MGVDGFPRSGLEAGGVSLEEAGMAAFLAEANAAPSREEPEDRMPSFKSTTSEEEAVEAGVKMEVLARIFSDVSAPASVSTAQPPEIIEAGSALVRGMLSNLLKKRSVPLTLAITTDSTMVYRVLVVALLITCCSAFMAPVMPRFLWTKATPAVASIESEPYPSSLSMQATAAALLAALLAWVALHSRGKRLLPPLAEAGLFATVRAMTTAHAPWFLLALARTWQPRLPLAHAAPAALGCRGGRETRCTHLALTLTRTPTPTPTLIPNPSANLNQVDAVCTVFEASIDKPSLYAVFDGAACGLPTMFTMKSADPRWAHARKGVVHAFAHARIQRALLRGQPKLECVLQGVEALQGAPFDPAVLLAELSLDLLGDSMLGGFDFGLAASAASGAAATGPERGTPPSLGREYISNLTYILPEYALRQPNDPLRKYLLRLLPRALASRCFPLAAAADHAAQRNMQIAQLVLDEFRQRRDAASPEERAALDETILGHLVDNNMYSSEAMRCADVGSFLAAGHDTTGYTLAWFLCELARSPERAARLRDELARHEPAEASPYLHACVHETLRLWPVGATGSIRETLAPIELADGTRIPAGAICQMPFLLIHRLADIPAPEEWRPERWLDDEGKVRTPDRLLPVSFSLGKHNCVGQALATAELRRVAAALAIRFEFEAVEPPRLFPHAQAERCQAARSQVERRQPGEGVTRVCEMRPTLSRHLEDSTALRPQPQRRACLESGPYILI